MRRRKSVGTVRKAGGVRCLFDGRPLGLSASGLLVVGAVFGDRLTKQTGDSVWGARLQAGYGGEGGRLPAGEGRAPRQGADSVGEHQTVLQRRCARDLKSTTSCPLGRLAVCSRLRGCACATTRPMAGRGKREPSRASGGAWCEVDPDPDAAWLWRALPHATARQPVAGWRWSLISPARVQRRGAGFGPQPGVRVVVAVVVVVRTARASSNIASERGRERAMRDDESTAVRNPRRTARQTEIVTEPEPCSQEA
jgi:hypothetical protein